MALSIQTQPAILNYNITKSQLSIEQPRPQVEAGLSLPQVRVEATLPKITIDQTQAFNESGLKTVQAFSDEYVSYAKARMQESVGRIAEQGTQMTDIHLGGNAIAEQASYNAYDQFYGEFGMVTMPRSRPEIQVREGNININVTEGQITGKIIPGKPQINYRPGNVERYMAQYNSISIRYEGENLDYQI